MIKPIRIRAATVDVAAIAKAANQAVSTVYGLTRDRGFPPPLPEKRKKRTVWAGPAVMVWWNSRVDHRGGYRHDKRSARK